MMDIKTHYSYTKHTENGEDIWLTPSHLILNTSISVGKESTCNAVDPSLIPGLGRSVGDGIGYPLPYSWASLMAQLVKNLPAMQETQVQSLG